MNKQEKDEEEGDIGGVEFDDEGDDKGWVWAYDMGKSTLEPPNK